MGHDWLLAVLYNVPKVPKHLFLTGPISYLVIGLALAPGARLCLAPAGGRDLAGAMLSLAIMLTDPSLHDPFYTWTPVLAAFWIVAAVALTLHAFRRRWFPIFGRILGSWLIAIGLLYGGASLAPNLSRRHRLPKWSGQILPAHATAAWVSFRAASNKLQPP